MRRGAARSEAGSRKKPRSGSGIRRLRGRGDSTRGSDDLSGERRNEAGEARAAEVAAARLLAAHGVAGYLGGLAVAEGFDPVVRGEDGRLLTGEDVADVGGEVLLEGFLVGFLGDVFALLRGCEQGVIPTAEFGFELSPGAVDFAGDHAALMNVFDAEPMEFVFKLAGEVGTLLRLLEEEGASSLILEVCFEVHEALVAVAEHVNQFAKRCFYFFGIDRFCHVVPLSWFRFLGCKRARVCRMGFAPVVQADLLVPGAAAVQYRGRSFYETMAHMVFCAKYKAEMEGLDEPPFDSDFGQKIYKSVSKKAWGEWVERQKMLLNEYRLQPWTREAQEFLVEQMNEFFFGEGGAAEGVCGADALEAASGFREVRATFVYTC